MKIKKYDERDLFKAVAKAAEAADMDHIADKAGSGGYYVGFGMMGPKKRLAVSYWFETTRKGKLKATLIVSEPSTCRQHSDDRAMSGEELRLSTRRTLDRLGVKPKHINRVVGFLDTIVPTKRMLQAYT